MMSHRLLSLAIVSTLLASNALCQEKKEPPPIRFKLTRLDPALDKLIDRDAKLEELANGFAWTEGPVWIPEGKGHLLFSDIPNNRIVKWEEGKGTSDFLKPIYAGTRTDLREPGTNGLFLDPEGRLVMCEHGNRRVARLEKDGKTRTTLVDRYQGTLLNSPNDGCYRSNGDLYFTDPPYGRWVKEPRKPLDMATWFPDVDLGFNGVYRLSKDGKLTLLTKEMTKPNGIAFSPDEKTLYVAQSDPLAAIWKSFPVKDDGTLGEGKLFFDSTSNVGKMPGLPDGMKVDKDGNLFATGPGGVLIFSPQGKHLGTIETGVPTANCGWGEDGSVLYVCCNTGIARIKTLTRGPRR
jgi:gluconolactonase